MPFNRSLLAVAVTRLCQTVNKLVVTNCLEKQFLRQCGQAAEVSINVIWFVCSNSNFTCSAARKQPLCRGENAAPKQVAKPLYLRSVQLFR
jgi:hypothetical protein